MSVLNKTKKKKSGEHNLIIDLRLNKDPLVLKPLDSGSPATLLFDKLPIVEGLEKNQNITVQ